MAIIDYERVEEKYQAIYKEILTRAVSEIEDRLGEGNEVICFIYKIFSEQHDLSLKVLSLNYQFIEIS